MDTKRGFSVKKFLAIAFSLSYILMVGFMMYMRIETVPTEFIAFSGMVNLIVGAYFGNSIARENKN